MKTALHFIASLLLIFCFTNASAQEASADANESEEELPKFVFEKAIVLGASYTHVKFRTIHRTADGSQDRQYGGYSSSDFSDSQDATGGILLSISSPKLSQKLKLVTGLIVNSYSSEVLFGEYNYVKRPYGVGGWYRISALYATVPLMWQIDLSQKALVPYFKLGPSVGILARVSHHKRGWSHDMYGNRHDFLDTHPDNKPIALGGSSAFGLKFPAFGKHHGLFELGYQANDGLAPRKRADQFNQIFSAMLGVTF